MVGREDDCERHLTSAVPAQVFHTINALVFNGVARRLHDCNSGTGMKLKFRLSQLVDWLRKQMSLTGEAFLMVCEKQLAHSFQVRLTRSSH